MKYLIRIICMICLSLTACSQQAPDSEMGGLLNQVEALKLGRGGYILGKALTEAQSKIGQDHPIEQPTPGLYKFQDGDLFIVAQKKSDRVLILYEQYDPATPEIVQALVGDLFFDFGNPTVLAHDKILYWVYDAKGIMSEEAYHQIKKDKGSLKPLATLKLSSSIPILGKSDAGSKGMGATGPKPDPQDTGVYYVLSSQRVLDIVAARK